MDQTGTKWEKEGPKVEQNVTKHDKSRTSAQSGTKREKDKALTVQTSTKRDKPGLRWDNAVDSGTN